MDILNVIRLSTDLFEGSYIFFYTVNLL